jgi:hypothetical protein
MQALVALGADNAPQANNVGVQASAAEIYG